MIEHISQQTKILNNFKTAKAIAENKQNKILLAHVFIQLSDLYLVAGLRKEAESFQALETASKLENTKFRARRHEILSHNARQRI